MDKTGTVGQKCPAKELDLHFLTLKKYQRTIQTINSFKSYRVYVYRQTLLRNFDFRVQEVSKREDLLNTEGVKNFTQT